MTFTEQFLKFLHSVPDPVAYLFLGLSAFVENVFPPIPGDTITAFGAFLVGIGKLSFLGVYASTTLGSLLGFLCLFKIGGWLGRRFFIERDYRFFRASTIVRAEQWFERYGYYLIVMNRFLPGVRSAVALAGGICCLRGIRVALLALVSAALWNMIWILTGYMLGSNWSVVEATISGLLLKFHIGVAVVIALFVLLIAWRRILVRRRAGEERNPPF
jgi:membrane protein DedA with SNARE-associated domain